MYAIIEASGRQYKVEKSCEFLVNRIEGKKGNMVKLKRVLFAKTGASYLVGTPYITDAYITCEILSQERGRKVVAFKYKRRKSQKSKVGHRQNLTRLRVKEIKI